MSGVKYWNLFLPNCQSNARFHFNRRIIASCSAASVKGRVGNKAFDGYDIGMIICTGGKFYVWLA
jgi:hypothetical protein